MDIFQYIAENDEYGAKAICNKYGYDLQGVSTSADMGICLQQLVVAEGEPAMTDILSLHPDKDIIVETFGSGDKKEKDGCGCNGKKKKSLDSYVPEPANNIKESHIFIFAGALLLAAAIIAK